jgi:nucleoside 2-deoxyribosyltransferase
MRIYLAGPIRGKTFDEAVEWRDDAAAKLAAMGHVTMSPMRGKDYLRDFGPLNGGENTDGSYPAFPLSSGHGLFMRDTFDVQMADCVLANFEGATQLSIGTCMEIQRAYDLGKYVVTVVEPGSIHDHAFIQQASSLVVPTLEAALEYIRVVGEPYADARVAFPV